MTCSDCGAILSTYTVGCPECRKISYDRLMTIEETPLRVDADFVALVTGKEDE